MTLVMSPTECEAEAVFVPFLQAMKILDTTAYGVYKEILGGRVRVQIRPGNPPKCHRCDLQRIASEK